MKRKLEMNRSNSSPVIRPTYARVRARKDMHETMGRSVSNKRPARESGVDAKTRRPDLDDQLKALQNEAIEEYEAYRRSHEQLWKLLARAYLWWRDASREVGYLDS